MKTLDFSDGLVENVFTFGNTYAYGEKRSYGLYFSKDSQNYPFVLKGGVSNDFELEYSWNTHQLRGRLLSTKKLKEVMNTAKIPLYFVIKNVAYLIGKGFLSTYDVCGNHQPLFIACVDGTKTISSIEQVKFYVSKMVYEDRYKAVQPAIKDLVVEHSGDVVMCKNILDYMGERLSFPRRCSLSELNNYKQAVVRTCLMQGFVRGNPEMEPFVIESNRGTVSIMPDIMSSGADESITIDLRSSESRDNDVLRTLRSFTGHDPEEVVSSVPGTTDDLATAIRMATLGTPSDVVGGLMNTLSDPSFNAPDDDLPY